MSWLLVTVDLHAHSTASDGSVDPTDLVSLAARKGLTALALTDHDSHAGLPAKPEAATREGLELVPGTELSLNFDKGGMHLVVLRPMAPTWLWPSSRPSQWAARRSI